MKLSKITIKVIVSYILLICVSVLAGYIVFKEINKLSNQEKINQEDRNKIVQISKILSMVNETENAGRIAIRSDQKEALQTFLEKNVYLQNEVLKFRRDITSEECSIRCRGIGYCFYFKKIQRCKGACYL